MARMPLPPLPGSPAKIPAAAADTPALRPPRFSTVRTVVAIMLREMGSTYGRSPGGYLWAVLEPLGIILILSVAFSFIVRTPSLGTSFILFYATGWLSFGFYTEIESKARRALRANSALLAYPRVIWLDAVLGRTLLAVLTEITTMVILVAVILTLVDAHVTLDIRPVLLALLIAGLLGLGVGLVDCLLSGLFQIWAVVWGIVTRPLMIISGVLFLYEDVPPQAQAILWWNPLIHVTGLFRRGFYGTYDAAYASPVYCLAVALTLVAFGLLMMRAWHKLVLEA